ncbi:hypothetical protein BJP40_19945 [Streptomyces sp. CC53]|uniref:hypothetical protein n=1 Tax=Streptomyces sp. CC53 TaxID=1906740 RepID=UPI0008DE37EA|nr:hypothetical protein [Streptomyces sp. CC53]OII64613.1 hypothetical protein BJP40_19945 [Streptomyces sp. CC53]
MTPAEELHAVAAFLRELAERATHENRPRWTTGHTLGSRTPVVVDDQEQPSVLIETYAARLEAVNRYVAAMDPAVGTALADWLEAEANRTQRRPPGWRTPDAQALAVARAITQHTPKEAL